MVSSTGSHPSHLAEGGKGQCDLTTGEAPCVPNLPGSDIKLWWLPSFLVYLVSEASRHCREP